MKREFMDTLEHLLTSQRTSPVVRGHLLDLLATAVYVHSATSLKNESSLRLLWILPGRPDEVSLVPCVKVHPSRH